MKQEKRKKTAGITATAEMIVAVTAAIKLTEVTEKKTRNLTTLSQTTTETITAAKAGTTTGAVTGTTIKKAATARITEITGTATDTRAITKAAEVTAAAKAETAITEIMAVAMEQPELKNSERIDDLQRAGLRIIQDPDRFCFGMDAVLLSHFASCPEGGKLLDLGTGTGIIPILMSALTKASQLTGLEIQEESADMADRSVSLNGIGDRVSVVRGDIKEAGRIFPRASFDCMTCNPPYLQGDHGIVNPADAKAIARHEVLCTLEDVVGAAEQLLKPNGHFYMVHRPFRLSEIMCTMHDHNLEPKRMRLVYPMADREPNMVLIEGIRGAKMRITVEKPLILQNSDGSYTDEVKELYGF